MELCFSTTLLLYWTFNCEQVESIYIYIIHTCLKKTDLILSHLEITQIQ